jgi:hypothetical protein
MAGTKADPAAILTAWQERAADARAADPTLRELGATLARLAQERAAAEAALARISAELTGTHTQRAERTAAALLEVGGDFGALDGKARTADASPLLAQLREAQSKVALIAEAERMARDRISYRRVDVAADANAAASAALVEAQVALARDALALVVRARRLRRVMGALAEEGVPISRPGFTQWTFGPLADMTGLFEPAATMAGILDRAEVQAALQDRS